MKLYDGIVIVRKVSENLSKKNLEILPQNNDVSSSQ